MTYRQLITDFINNIRSIYSEDEAKSIAYIVFEHETGWSKIDVHEHFDNYASLSDIRKTEEIRMRLLQHEPIQYILGTTYFYNSYFDVSPGVLIPRPETEELVDRIVKDHTAASDIHILDVGTGSGCIAISLAKHLPNAKVCAIDISEKAIETATQNNKKNNTEVICCLADVLKWENQSCLQNSSFDVIVSNPPYIPREDKKKMKKNVLNYEPELALFVENNDPLLFYRTISQMAVKHLSPGGLLYFEIHEDFGNQTVAILHEIGFHSVHLIADINEKDRMIKASLKY